MDSNVLCDVINVGEFFCSVFPEENKQETNQELFDSSQMPLDPDELMTSDEATSITSQVEPAEFYFDLLKTAAESITLFKEKNYALVARSTPEEISIILCSKVHAAEKIFDEYQSICFEFNKGLYWYWKGKMYNSSPAHRNLAIECLVKAVKLDPTRVEAWNELGECYFYLGDSKLAFNCFKGALNRELNKVSFRNLSMICRKDSFGMIGKDRETVVLKGIQYAKDAVNLDPTDGESWAILGNSYLALFFAGETDPRSTRLALQAYRLGEKNGGNSPELHYNKAVALLFCEDYPDSHESFQAAISLDPAWKLAVDMNATLIKYLDLIQDFTKSKGRLKTRRLKQLSSELKKNPMLGPSVKDLTYIPFNMLSDIETADVMISGKVIWSCQIDKCIPFTFGLIDVNSDVITVTMYNLASGKGVIIGDTVVLPQPTYSEMEFTINDKVYSIKKVRVSSPQHVLVNGKPLKPEHFGQCSLISLSI